MMRNLRCLDAYRRTSNDVFELFGFFGDETCGVFDLPHSPTGVTLKIIACSGMGWDHVSVSLPNRCPNWPEMEFAKRTFFNDDETAMQLHVPPSEHISKCHTCLHLWRPNDGRQIPRPPSDFVA